MCRIFLIEILIQQSWKIWKPQEKMNIIRFIKKQ